MFGLYRSLEGSKKISNFCYLLGLVQSDALLYPTVIPASHVESLWALFHGTQAECPAPATFTNGVSPIVCWISWPNCSSSIIFPRFLVLFFFFFNFQYLSFQPLLCSSNPINHFFFFILFNSFSPFLNCLIFLLFITYFFFFLICF